MRSIHEGSAMNRYLLLTTALLGSTAAWAQAGAPAQGRDHAPRPDPYGEATITRAETQAKAEAQFATLDTDHDGSLSADEFSMMFPEGRMRLMAPMMMSRFADADNDGKITRAELVAVALKRFDTADANHDGQVTKAERDAAREAMRARRSERMRDRDGDGSAVGGGGDDAGPPPGPPPPDDGRP
jgi:Ca2+-binding EF-hand superfamily protein